MRNQDSTSNDSRNSSQAGYKSLFFYGGRQYRRLPNGLLRGPDGGLWRKIEATTTAYVAEAAQCGSDYLNTATMTRAREVYGIAADPRAIPYGTTLHVAGYGVFPVDDTGGAMRQAWRRSRTIHLDLRIPHRRYDGVIRSTAECNQIAMRHGIQRNRIILLRIE